MNAGRKLVLSLVCLICFEWTGIAQSSTIMTYAGAEPAMAASGPAAITQFLGRPVSVMLDNLGGLYLTSSDQHRIYRVSADGMLAVIAGDGTRGFSGDGGPAFSAQLMSPSDVASDRSGNLWIADSGNHRIRLVTPDGVIRSVAGDGTAGFSGDGGPALSAQLNAPAGVAVDDAGNLFISDSANHRIRRITPDGVISTVAGTGTSGFSGDDGPATAAQVNRPWGITLDAAGSLWIADSANHRVRQVTPNGVIRTVAGNGTAGFSGDGGPATLAKLAVPSDVVVDSAGNLFIVEFGNWFIRKVTPAGVISWVAGDWEGSLVEPVSVAVDAAGNLLVADSGNNRIKKIDPAGVMTTVAGRERGGFNGDGGVASSAELHLPGDVATDSQGNLFIADTGNNRIRKVTPAGIISTVAGSGTGGGFSGDGGPANAAQLMGPNGVAVDAQGNLLIADTINHRIRKVTPGGIITTVAGSGLGGFGGDGGPATVARLSYPQDVAVDAQGNLFIADSGNGSIRKVTPAGIISTVAGTGRQARDFTGDGGSATSSALRYPTSVAADAQGNLFIAEFYLSRIRRVASNGIITTAAGIGATGFSGDGSFAIDAQIGSPWGVAVDGAGNLLIADYSSNRIRKVTPNGIITTVAGVGTAGFSGDFGPAASAQLNLPQAMTVDAEGNVYIADTWNYRIRKVTTHAGPVLTLDPTQYRVGDSWSVKVGYGAPNTPARLLGTSNGQPWEIPEWRNTDGRGSFQVDGMFAAGTEGRYTLQVEIGGVFSNTITFVVLNEE